MSDGRVDAMERLLLERLERVVRRPADVVRRGLEIAGLERVPSDRVELELFCRGAMDEALTEALGATAAQAVVEELADLTGSVPPPPPDAPVEDAPVARSGTRRRRKDRSGTRARRTPFVVVASRDPARAEAVVRALGGRAEAAVTNDVFTLMQETESHLDRELVLVLDGTVPGLRGPMLMTLARVLPPSAQVVFWGAPPPTGSVELRATTLPAEATPDEVAELVAGEGEAREAEDALDVILLADDDLVWLTTLERRLRHEGYGVVTAADGFAALEAAIDHRPALVVTDFHMPTLDGQQLAALIRGRFGDASPPILMVTSAELGPVEGVDRVLSKAAPFEELLDAVRALLPDDGSAALARPAG